MEFPIEGRRIDILGEYAADIPVIVELKVSRGHERTIAQCLYYRAKIINDSAEAIIDVGIDKMGRRLPIRPPLMHTSYLVSSEKKKRELLPTVKRSSERGRILGTLSFPVGKRDALPDHSDLIADIIRLRKPGLLLCAGWSISSDRNLQPIMDAARKTKTIVVLETSARTPISFRIESGKESNMGEQFFGTREESDKDPEKLTALADALGVRRFRFAGRPVLLLVCGEVMVVEGRTRAKVHFHRCAPPKLRAAVRAERVLILNPTHTRMGRPGVLQAWRGFLSQKGRVYVSASNWNVSKIRGRRQKPSPTLHSLWHDGKPTDPSPNIPRHCDSYCYREWVLPR